MIRKYRVYGVAATLCVFTLFVNPATLAAQTAAAAAAPSTATALELQPLVERLIRDSGVSANVCVYVEDASTRKVLANVNGEVPFAPASNN